MIPRLLRSFCDQNQVRTVTRLGENRKKLILKITKILKIAKISFLPISSKRNFFQQNGDHQNDPCFIPHLLSLFSAILSLYFRRYGKIRVIHVRRRIFEMRRPKSPETKLGSYGYCDHFAPKISFGRARV